MSEQDPMRRDLVHRLRFKLTDSEIIVPAQRELAERIAELMVNILTSARTEWSLWKFMDLTDGDLGFLLKQTLDAYSSENAVSDHDRQVIEDLIRKINKSNYSYAKRQILG